jgi:hypothetical protein
MIKRAIGFAAINIAENSGRTLCRVSGSDGRVIEGLSVEKAREVAEKDQNLIFLDPPSDGVLCFALYSRSTGAFLGEFPGVDADDAILSLAQDAGYRTTEEMDSVCGSSKLALKILRV